MLSPDELRFHFTQRLSEMLRDSREEFGSQSTAIKCKAMIESAFAELSTIEGEKPARLFIGGLTFARDPHHQTDFSLATFPTMG